MKVTIYIETTIAGPGTREGRYGAVVEYITKKGKKEIRDIYGKEEETTWYRSILMAAGRSLKLLIHPCEVELVTDCAFIVNMINRGNVKVWARNGWRNSSGDEIRNKELWMKIYCFMSMHKITAVLSKHHDYKRFLRKNMYKEEDKTEC